MRTVRRLRLRCFLLFTSLLMSCRLYYLTQSILCMAHHKNTVCSYGGPFGHCPRVLDSFALKGLQLFKYLLFYKIVLIIFVHHIPLFINQPGMTH